MAKTLNINLCYELHMFYYEDNVLKIRILLTNLLL